MVVQIEQFIESIFPSQNPSAIAALQSATAPVPPEEVEQRAMAEEAKWDTSNSILFILCAPLALLT